MAAPLAHDEPMETVSRYLNIVYLAFGLVMVWLGVRTLGLVFGWFGPRFDRILVGDLSLSALAGVALGAGVTIYCWRNVKIYQWVTDVILELSKVTWPEKAETQRSTYVVIVFSILIAIVLAGFDFFWKFTTDLLL
jgi:preprotein translocase SecE subunit